MYEAMDMLTVLTLQRESASNVTFEEARQMCDEHFQTCPGTAAKDDVMTDYNATLDNCAQDVMVNT